MKRVFQDRDAHAVLYIFLAISLFVVMPRTAFAHARLLRSSPESGQTTPAPQKIDLWFNELLDGQFNSIEVLPVAEVNGKHHARLTLGGASVDPRDRTHLTVGVQRLEPGNYYVEWRVLSLDGHSAPGRFQFQVSKPR